MKVLKMFLFAYMGFQLLIYPVSAQKTVQEEAEKLTLQVILDFSDTGDVALDVRKSEPASYEPEEMARLLSHWYSRILHNFRNPLVGMMLTNQIQYGLLKLSFESKDDVRKAEDEFSFRLLKKIDDDKIKSSIKLHLLRLPKDKRGLDFYRKGKLSEEIPVLSWFAIMKYAFQNYNIEDINFICEVMSETIEAYRKGADPSVRENAQKIPNNSFFKIKVMHVKPTIKSEKFLEKAEIKKQKLASRKPQPFWEVTSFPAQAMVRSLAVDSKGRVFGSTDEGEVYRSDDQGKTWVKSTPAPKSFINFIEIDTYDNIFVGTSKTFDKKSKDGLLRSVDGGKTWESIFSRPFAAVQSFAFQSDGPFYCGIFWGVIFRSDDKGRTWKRLSEVADDSIQAILIMPGGGLLVGTDRGGLFLSENGKTGWRRYQLKMKPGPTNIAGHLFPGIQIVHTLKIGFNGKIYAGTVNGLAMSPDNGASWIELPLKEDIDGLVFDHLSKTIFAVAGFSGVFQSQDEGKSWQPIGLGLEGKQSVSLALDPKGYLYVGTLGKGLYRSRTSIF